MKQAAINPEQFPAHVREHLVPSYEGDVVYECIGCGETYHIDQFLYTCPACKSLLRLHDRAFAELKKIDGATWRDIFDYRRMLRLEPLKGIFLFKEILFPDHSPAGHHLSGRGAYGPGALECRTERPCGHGVFREERWP